MVTRRAGDPLYLGQVRNGHLVIYSDGKVVAKFPREEYPQLIRDMAADLKGDEI